MRYLFTTYNLRMLFHFLQPVLPSTWGLLIMYFCVCFLFCCSLASLISTVSSLRTHAFFFQPSFPSLWCLCTTYSMHVLSLLLQPGFPSLWDLFAMCSVGFLSFIQVYFLLLVRLLPPVSHTLVGVSLSVSSQHPLAFLFPSSTFSQASGPVVADAGSASGPHSNACNFVVFIYFLIPVLSRSYFTSRTPDRDQKIEQLFFFLLVQFPQPGDIHELHGERFCACHPQVLEKVPCAKSG